MNRCAVVILTVAICLTTRVVADDAKAAAEYRTQLTRWATLIDPSFSTGANELKDRTKRLETCAKIETGIKRLNTLYERYSTVMAKVVQKLTAQRLGGVTTKDVKEIDTTTAVTILKNLEKVVDDLNHLALLKEQVKQLKTKVAKQEAQIKKLKAKLAEK